MTSLAQIIARCLFSAKPLPEPTLTHLKSFGAFGKKSSEILINQNTKKFKEGIIVNKVSANFDKLVRMSMCK